MSSELDLSGNYPAITFTGTEQTPHPYFEEREVSGVMYRTLNAKYNTSTFHWGKSYSGPAFAIAQYPDGSIKNYMVPTGTTSWTAWEGNGQYSVYNVRDFGAVADGSTDDSGAFNAAAMAAQTNGGIIYCPPGMYAIQYTILLYDNTELVGDYSGNTVITALEGLETDPTSLTATNMMVANSDYASPPSSGTTQTTIAVRNISFNNNASEQSAVFLSGGAALTFIGVYNVTIERCQIFNCANNGISVTRSTGPETAALGNVRILDNTVDIMAVRDSETGALTRGNIAIQVEALNVVLIRGNVINYNPNQNVEWSPTWSNDGIDIYGCSEVTITGNLITLTVDGISATDGSSPEVSASFTIADNIIENYLGFGVHSFQDSDVDSAISQIAICNNVVIAIQSPAAPEGASQNGILVDTGITPAYHYSVSSNVLVGPFAIAAIELAANLGSCTGNSIDVNASTAYAQVGVLVKGNQLDITGNEISNGSGVGTAVAIQFMPIPDGPASQQNILVENNNAVACTTGIDVEHSLTGCLITNNNVWGCSTGLNIGTGFTLTNVRIADNFGINPPAPTIIMQPSMTSSAHTNTFPFDCTVYVKPAGSTISQINVNGQSVLGSVSLVTPISVHVPVNGSIQLTYSMGTPNWVWIPA